MFEVLTRIYQVWYNGVRDGDRVYKILGGEIEMENIKIVNCGVCGIEMMVSKFASNTPNCSDCRAEGYTINRKKSNKPRKNSKAWYIEKIMSKFDEYKEIHEQLEELHNQGKIKYGVVMVHGLYHDYTYKWFYGLLLEDSKCKGYGTGKKNTALWHYRYHLERIEEEIRKAREIIEENK